MLYQLKIAKRAIFACSPAVCFIFSFFLPRARAEKSACASFPSRVAGGVCLKPCHMNCLTRFGAKIEDYSEGIIQQKCFDPKTPLANTLTNNPHGIIRQST